MNDADLIKLRQAPDPDAWIRGDEAPHSQRFGGHRRRIDRCVILQPDAPRIDLWDKEFVVVESNEMKVIIGADLRDEMEIRLEASESPLDAVAPGEEREEIRRGLDEAIQKLQARPDLERKTVKAIKHMLEHEHSSIWNAKFDLETPCDLPHMKIKLKPDAAPIKIKRVYRWSKQQREFLDKHLKKLVRKRSGAATAILSPRVALRRSNRLKGNTLSTRPSRLIVRNQRRDDTIFHPRIVTFIQEAERATAFAVLRLGQTDIALYACMTRVRRLRNCRPSQ